LKDIFIHNNLGCWQTSTNSTHCFRSKEAASFFGHLF